MIIETSVGPFTVGYFGDELICDFGSRQVDSDPPKKLAAQLDAYFSGTFTGTFDAPMPDGPPFTRRCWEACRAIPYGATITYSQLATNATSPKAMRAAGQAMRHNPTPIITPCHRVVAATGALHGFAGTTDPNSIELQRKRFLLDLEKRTIDA